MVAPPDGAGDSAPPLDTLVIALDAEPRELLSPFASTTAERALLDMVGASLLATDFDCGLTFRPRLAKSYAWSDDGRTLSFELRDDVSWSDGERVDAHDVAAAFAIAADPAAASPHASAVATLAPGARPRVVDATHLVFEFADRGDATAMLARVATLPPVPAHALAGLDAASLRAHPLNTSRPLSSGPWALSAWTSGEELVLEPNAGWPGPRPQLARVTLRVLPDYAERVAQLERGAVDLVDDVDLADADRLAATPDIRTVRRPDRGQHDIFWNTVDPAARAARDAVASAKGKAVALGPPPPHPLFGTASVRRALSAAIDVDAMLREVARSPRSGEVYGRASVGTVSPQLCGYHHDALLPIPHDAAAARAALAKAGWADNNGDGVLERGGVPFRFTLSVTAGNDTRRRLAGLVQANLREVGVDTQLEFVEPSALTMRLQSGQFDAALSGWTTSPHLDASAWGRDNPLNFTSYQDPRLDALIERGRAETDPARAQATWREFQSMVYANQPWTFLFWSDEIVAVSRRFENTTIDELGAFRRPESWTVARGKVKRPPT